MVIQSIFISQKFHLLFIISSHIYVDWVMFLMFLLQYYSFTKFAMMLNELDDEPMRAKLAPTDSRLRPDIRSLELGNIGQYSSISYVA